MVGTCTQGMPGRFAPHTLDFDCAFFTAGTYNYRFLDVVEMPRFPVGMRLRLRVHSTEHTLLSNCSQTRSCTSLGRTGIHTSRRRSCLTKSVPELASPSGMAMSLTFHSTNGKGHNKASVG